MERTFDDALTALEGIVARLDKRITELTGDKTKRSEAARLRAQREAVRSALDELREGPEDTVDQDTADVPAAVVELVEYLETGPTPPHPYAGTYPGGTEEPGHCRPCWFVGHPVAHPERSCADVGCRLDHDVAAEPAPALDLVTVAALPVDSTPLEVPSALSSMWCSPTEPFGE